MCRVVIAGGGVIGASIAYYLSELGVAATVVEREGVANAASGTNSSINTGRTGSTAVTKRC